mgnify:FL=1
MYNSTLALKNNQNSWNLKEWDYLATEISNAFRFTNEEKDVFSNNPTAKLIASIPFVANCIEPERTAIAHLCLYVAELKGFQKYCSHVPSDDSDIFNRLAFISTFEGGNRANIEHGMNILALIMIENYKRTEKSDKEKGIYNPFVAGTWNYKQIKNKLLWDINKIEVPEIDWILTETPKMQWY